MNLEEERNKCLARLETCANTKSRCRTLFELVALEARLGRPEEAIKYMRDAIANGLDPVYATEFKMSPNYRSLRDLAEFQSLLAFFEGSSLVVNEKSVVYVKGEKERCIADGLICLVCDEPLHEPLVHLTCRHMFCSACISPLSTCPNCQGEITSANLHNAVPILIINKLDSLKCHCPRCQKTFERPSLQAHVAQCPVVCPYGCKTRVAPGEVEEHKLVCPAVDVVCPAADVACPWSGVRRDLPNHARVCRFVKQQDLLRRFVELEKQRLPALEARLPALETLLPALEAANRELEASNRALGARLAVVEAALAGKGKENTLVQ